MADDATTFVFRFEDEGDSGPAPRPGDAARARRESAQSPIGSQPQSRRGFRPQEGGEALRERRRTTRTGEGTDSIRELLSQLSGVPLIGRFARAAETMVASLEATVRAINALRAVFGASALFSGARQAAAAAGAGAQRQVRDEILSARVRPTQPRAQRAQPGQRPQAPGTSPRGPQARPSGRSPFDNGRVIDVTPRRPGTALVPIGGHNRLPAVRSSVPAVRRRTAVAQRQNTVGPARATGFAVRAGAAEGASEAGGAAAAGAMSVSGPIAILAVAAAGAALALRALYNRATRLQTALAGYEGTLAAAQARRQAAGVIQDIRSAQYLGPSLARQSDAQARLERSMQRILDVFTKAGLERLSPILEKVASVAEKVDRWFADHEEQIGGAIEAGVDAGMRQALMALFGPAALVPITQALKSIDDKTKDPEKFQDFFYGFSQLPDLTLEDRGKVNERATERHKVGFRGIGAPEVRLP